MPARFLPVAPGAPASLNPPRIAQGAAGAFKEAATEAMKPKPKEWTVAEKQALIRLVRNGAGTSEISAKLGRHAASVKRMAREMNLLLKKF